MKNQILIRVSSYLIIGFALVALSLSSCKKSDDIGKDFKISYKANGVLEEFTSENSFSGLLLTGALPNRLTFDVKKSSGGIGLAVYDMKALTETTYSGLDVRHSSSQLWMIGVDMGYQKNNANFASEISDNADVSVTITELTSKTVRGKFSGKVFGAEDVEVAITEGEFFVPIKISNSDF